MRIYTFSIYSLQILVDANLWLFEIIKDASFGTPMKSSNIVVLHSIKKNSAYRCAKLQYYVLGTPCIMTFNLYIFYLFKIISPVASCGKCNCNKRTRSPLQGRYSYCSYCNSLW